MYGFLSYYVSYNEVSYYRNKPTPPPPLPPHGVPTQPSERVKQDTTEEYRPPVPPHRNIGVTASNSAEATPLRKHHHHHHHRNSKQPDRDSKQSQSYVRPVMEFGSPKQEVQEGSKDMPVQDGMRSVFEFDDEPQETAKVVLPANGVKLRQKPAAKSENDETVYFVQYPKSPNPNGNGKYVKNIYP